MTKQEKIIEKFIKNPESVRLSELIKVLYYCGYTKIDAKGSHVKYKKENAPDIVLAIHNNDCKKVYKIKARNTLFGK